MKKFTGLLCLLVLSVLSCSKYDDSEIWDYVKEMNSRLTALEEKCKEMNTNISALQTIVGALENNDCITNVAPITKDGVVLGYIISFLKSAPISIYNGNDGNDGYTPVIGVKQDSDGFYYWTIDGEWLLTDGGEKVRASAADGTNGTNGTTPQLKIEDEFWYVSYDEGTTWQMLGRATGDKGADGQFLFSSVEVGTNEVKFVLTDGTTFSIPLQSYTIDTEHKYVDLGLPSGTLWATCNVGANKPGEPGDYFAWGEILPKEDYSWNNYLWGGRETMTKYCFNYGYNGFIDNLTELEPNNDVATVNWDENWQMPSEEQLKEIVNSSYTKIDSRTLDGTLCIRITSLTNGNTIFLPYAGYRSGTDFYTNNGHYWSRSLSTTNSQGAYALNLTFAGSRQCGFSVRPVRKQYE